MAREQTPEERRRTRQMIGRQEKAAAGSTDPLYRRVSPDNSVDSAQLKDNAVPKRAVQTDAVDERVLASSASISAARAVGGDHIKDNVVDTRHLRVDAVKSAHINTGALLSTHFPSEPGTGRRLPGGADPVTARAENLADGAVGNSKVADSIKNPNRGVAGMRTITGPGNSLQSAGADHNHSVPFKAMPKEARDAVLAVRSRLRSLVGPPGPVEDLRRAVLALMVMALDDPDAAREEIEARMASEDGYADEYLEDGYADEYLEHNIPGTLEAREAGNLPRFYREKHPDLSW